MVLKIGAPRVKNGGVGRAKLWRQYTLMRAYRGLK
jgi:hypothetical protein